MGGQYYHNLTEMGSLGMDSLNLAQLAFMNMVMDLIRVPEEQGIP
jgi:hypothetical protein